jgi:protein-disulfide isomerase
MSTNSKGSRISREGIHWHNIEAMRFLLVLLPALVLTAQAQTTGASVKKVSDTKTAAPAVSKEGVATYKVAGSASAPMTIELYTDYECPACRNFFLTTLPELTKDFVATGKARLVHRDFRISSHKYTKIATRYANAAGQIGKFDIVTQQLFQTQPDWAQNGNVDGVISKVLSPAEMEKVRELVKNDTHLDDSVVRDEAMATSEDHLNETPTMVIVIKGKRESFGLGGMSYPILKQYLTQKLSQ